MISQSDDVPGLYAVSTAGDINILVRGVPFELACSVAVAFTISAPHYEYRVFRMEQLSENSFGVEEVWHTYVRSAHVPDENPADSAGMCPNCSSRRTRRDDAVIPLAVCENCGLTWGVPVCPACGAANDLVFGVYVMQCKECGTAFVLEKGWSSREQQEP